MKSIKYAMMMYLLTGAVSMQGMDDANKVVIRELKSIEELQSIVNEKPYITALIVKSSAEIETLIEPFRKLIATKAPRSYVSPIWRAEDFIAINVTTVPEVLKEFKLTIKGWDANGKIATSEASFDFNKGLGVIPFRTTFDIPYASANE